MRKLIKFVFILFLGVISCACVNRVAVQELNQKASDFIEAGDLPSAISRLEASVDLDGEIYESRYNLANVYISAKQFEKAAEHAKVATTLAKNEPAVFYTHGVAANSAANDIYEKKDENGNFVYLSLQTYKAQEDLAKKYIEYLTDANKSYDRYTQLVPNAEDTQQVIELMRDNKEKISAKAKEFNLEIPQ